MKAREEVSGAKVPRKGKGGEDWVLCFSNMVVISYFSPSDRTEDWEELMKSNPDKKLSQIAEESGFSGERSFFRNFKKVTGVTPRQWIESE